MSSKALAAVLMAIGITLILMSILVSIVSSSMPGVPFWEGLLTLLHIPIAGPDIRVVVNIPKQQLLAPLIIVNGELTNVTVQNPLYMFHRYGFSPYTVSVTETINLNGSRYTVNAIVTKVAVAIVGYNQARKYYQFPASNNFCQTVSLVVNTTIKIPNASPSPRSLIISKVMNDIANDTLNARPWKLTVSQCLNRVLTYYFTVTPRIRDYIDGGSVRLASYGVYWSGRFEGDYYVATSVGYEFVFNVLSRNGTRVGIIVADVQYQNGLVIISVWLIPRTRVSALDNAMYMVESTAH